MKSVLRADSQRSPDGRLRPDGTVPIPQDRLEAVLQMKRPGEPEEEAELVGYLASDSAGYITGQIVSVSGGAA